MIKKHVEKASVTLDALDSAREEALAKSRKIVRECKKAETSLRSGKTAEARSSLYSLLEDAKSFINKYLSSPNIYSVVYPYMSVAFQELAEDILLLHVKEGSRLPGHDELGIPAREYIIGLCDLVGELRREFLSNLITGNLEEAKRLLELMEEIYNGVSMLSYPDALVPLRRKTDYIRSLLEKSKSEFLHVSANVKLQESLKPFKSVIKQE